MILAFQAIWLVRKLWLIIKNRISEQCNSRVFMSLVLMVYNWAIIPCYTNIVNIRRRNFWCRFYFYYSLSSEWLICDSNKNKVAGVNSRFASVSELEIARKEKHAVRRGQYKEDYEFGLKVFKSKKRLTDVGRSSSFKTCPWQSQTQTAKSFFARH